MEQIPLEPIESPPLEPVAPPKPEPSFLSWWCGLPFVLYLIVEVIFGWPTAVAKDPKYPVMVFLGQFTAGLVLPLVISWAVYRFGGKSRSTASAVFCAATLWMILSAVAQSPFVTRSTQGGPTSFGTFRFDIPRGWSKLPSLREHNKAYLVKHVSTSLGAVGMIKVDLLDRPASLTLRELAQRAAGADGHVVDGSLSIDGEEGLRVETPSTDLSRPRFTVLVFHDDRLYCIGAAETKANESSAAFQQVLASWHWEGAGTVK